MSDGQWRYLSASVEGSLHRRLGLPCQDASACQIITADGSGEVLIAVVSDGAGSAERSEVGAALCCAQFAQWVEAFVKSGSQVRDITRDVVLEWLRDFQEEVSRRAQDEERSARDFACTILAAVVAADCGLFVQVGDGAIVTSPLDEPSEYCWIFWPQRGEYENTTFFVTDSRCLEHCEIEIREERFEEIALFTDGLQRITLNFGDQSAHSPFFRPMFAPLRSTSLAELGSLREALHEFLDSPRMNDRTDDDRTLILATRRSCTDSDIPGDDGGSRS